MDETDSDPIERKQKNSWFLKYLKNKGFKRTLEAVETLNDLELEQARVEFYKELEKKPELKPELLLLDENNEETHFFDPKYGDIFADQNESKETEVNCYDDSWICAFDERLGDILRNQHTHLKDKGS